MLDLRDLLQKFLSIYLGISSPLVAALLPPRVITAL